MSCYHPLKMYRTPLGEVKFGVAPADCRSFEVPCGKCIGCKLDRSRDWTTRILHEAKSWDSNWCLTLTYSDENLPDSRSLEYEDFQLFMKRLRKKYRGNNAMPDGGRPIRFFVCGEYGERNGRPHFHAILFNVDFPDKVQYRNSYWHSVELEELWGKGQVLIGSVSGASAAYVAGYIHKKALGQAARERYEDVVNLRTGELTSRRPEFVVMSRRPGIGAGWYEKFGGDLFPHDFAIRDGKKYKVPRYYLERFKRDADPAKIEEILYARYLKAEEQKFESTLERRAVREVVSLRRLDMFGQRKL